MDKKNRNTYRIPAGFNPWQTFDALRGLADALRHFTTEGPGTRDPIEYSDRCSLDGLIELLQREAHALHDYFTAIGDNTLLKLPLTDSDFESLHVKRTTEHEVKEPAALYAIR